MYTWAERSVMRCSQACDAVYLRRARRRSTPRRCPSTCSCRRETRWKASRWMHPAIHRRETAADLRPFQFPCRGIFACTPIDKLMMFMKRSWDSFSLSPSSLSLSFSLARSLSLLQFHDRRFLRFFNICRAKSRWSRCRIYDSCVLQFARDHYYSAYRRYRGIVNIRILYTDIYSRYKNSPRVPPPPPPPSRGSKSHDGKMKPILSRWKFIGTERPRAGTREIYHVNRRENKYARGQPKAYLYIRIKIRYTFWH